MAHVAKYTRNATKNLTRHYERAKDKDGNYIKFGNENIDTSKTHLNYNLAPNRDMKQGEFIKQKCDEFNCVKRDNINVMCSWVVTVPKDLPENQQREFFEQSYEFLNNRYGKDNVVSSYVHLDEKTPHMHYSFVPVVFDKKKDKYKVSAKDMINRTDLQTFHKDLSKHMERHFDKDIGIINEATKEGNKKVVELKRETLLQEYKKIDNRLERVQNVSESLSKTEKGINSIINQLDKVEAKRQRFSSNLTISQEDYSILISLAKKGESKVLDNIKLKAKLNDLAEKHEKLNSNYNKISKDNSKLSRENIDLKRENKSIAKSFKRVEKAISNLGVTDKVNNEIGKIIRQEKSHGIER